jgi:hypothetical protein
MRLLHLFAVISIASATAAGCGGDSAASVDSSTVSAVSVDGSKYLLAEEPDGAVGVIEARKSASDGDPVVIVGRIGGSQNPWIEGRAAFTMIDPSVVVTAAGAECAEGEICMDDCCAEDRADCTTLVKLVDQNGKVLAVDARQLLGITADDLLVVHGKVSKDAEGNFAVLADGVHVRR